MENQKMGKQNQTLLNASAFFFGFAALDIINLIIAYFNGSLKIDSSVTGVSGVAADTAVTISVIILLAIGSIGTILKLFLAIKGVRQAYGKGGKGRAHITWAKIIFVVLIIAIISTISGMTQGTAAWYSLISPIFSLVAAYFYIRSATALKDDVAL